MADSILVLADDLTGALETAAKFAEHGFPVQLITHPLKSYPPGVVVAATESRHLSPELAAFRVAAFTSGNPDVVYKKTDSALRGNIASELGALHRAYPRAAISYIPSYPELGRTTRQGHLHIDGVLAHLSDFATDALNPIATSSVASIAGDIPCMIYDGEISDDVLAATAAVLSSPGPHILAGPASVAAAIAEYLRPKKLNITLPTVRKCLVVNGSLHRRSSEQVRLAVDQDCLRDGWRFFESPMDPNLTAKQFAVANGTAVAREVERTAPEALFVFGGDTVFGILEAMRFTPLEPIGEVLTGIPVSKFTNGNLYLISKAGSFGPPDVICQVKKLLHGIQ
jgi:uncharacterized protein YgbK (DUF1537 family)